MIRYRQLTEAELAGIAEQVGASGAQKTPAARAGRKVKLSTVKKQHHARQTEKPPRKIAGRHAAPPTRKP